MCSRGAGESGGHGQQSLECLNRVGRDVQDKEGLRPLLLCLCCHHCHHCVGQSRDGSLVRGKCGLKCNLLVTLENERPEDATHLPHKARCKTSTLCTARVPN